MPYTEESINDWLSLRGNERLGANASSSTEKGKYAMNYCSVQDWLKQRDHLSGEQIKDFDDIMGNVTALHGSSGMRNWNAWGMKDMWEFNSWLLLLSGLEWRNLKAWGKHALISGNVSNEQGLYASEFSPCKLLCPRTARRVSNRWLHAHTPEKMFESGLTAYTFVVASGNVTIGAGWRERIHTQWDNIVKLLHTGRKKKLWTSHFYSHEVSAGSIEHRDIYPHTHVVVWVKGKINEEKLIQHFSPLSTHLDPRKFKTCNEDFKRFIGYLHAIYSWTDAYKREWTEENSKQTNIGLSNMIMDILDLYWGKRKTGGGNLPSRGKVWNEDNLQPDKKKSKIKKRLNKSMHNKENICEGFLHEIEELGLPKEAGEGMLQELGLLEESSYVKQAKEQSFLGLFENKYASLDELQTALREESENFKQGLKEAMLKEGADLATVEGMFKEAEDMLVAHIESKHLTKEAGGLGSILAKGLTMAKSPVAKSLASGRGFAATEDFAKSIVPALSEMKGLGGMPQLNSGVLRMGVGDKIQSIPGFKTIGNALTDSGEQAMRSQATHLSDKAFTENANKLFQQARTEARSASGVAATTQANLNNLKNMTGRKVDVAGAVPRATVQRAATQAGDVFANPMAARGIPAAAGPLGKHVRFTPGKGAVRAGMGALGGLMLGGPAGAVLGGLGGGITGTLGTGGTALAGAGLYGANKLLSSSKDSSGLPADRNRALPFMGNNWAGAAGGALLGSVVGNELGLDGPASWLLPLLGGAAGYNYLPQMMNSYKDPVGYGANAVPEIQRAGNASSFGYQPTL